MSAMHRGTVSLLPQLEALRQGTHLKKSLACAAPTSQAPVALQVQHLRPRGGPKTHLAGGSAEQTNSVRSRTCNVHFGVAPAAAEKASDKCLLVSFKCDMHAFWSLLCSGTCESPPVLVI